MNCTTNAAAARRSTRGTLGATAAALLLILGAGAAGAADAPDTATAATAGPSAPPAMAMTAPPTAWRFSVTPYIWATDTGLDLKLHNRQVVDTTIPVSDLLEDLDTIVQLRAEAQRGAFGIAIDLFDVTLSDHASGVSLPQGAGTANVDADFGMTILDVAGMYDVTRGRQGFVVLYGTRIFDERATIDATIEPTTGAAVDQRIDDGDTMVDGLLGLRLRRRLAGRFSLATQADISTGATDLTWSLAPSLNYHFGDHGRYALSAGYRRMTLDFADEAGVESKMTLSGVLLGVRLSL